MTRSADLDLGPHLSDAGDFTRHDDLEAHGHARVVIDDAALLFSGHFRQLGDDLVISRQFQSVTVHGYFAHGEHPVLSAPDGSSLSPSVVEAMTEGRPGPQLAAQQPPRGDAIGRVESVSGGVTVVRSGETLALHKNDLVFKGDAVQTDDHGALAIVFIDGTAFNLSASARMVLNDMVYQPGGGSNSSLLSIVQGSVSFVAGNIAHTGSMKVDTPVATMGIRGTAVHVVQPDHGPTRFSVMKEPNGRVGRYVLYSRQHPDQVIGTVADVDQVVEVKLDNGTVLVATLTKTELELLEEQALIRDVFETYEFGQRNPVLRFLHAPSQSGGSQQYVPPSGDVTPQTAPVNPGTSPVPTTPPSSQPGTNTPLIPPLTLSPLQIFPFLIPKFITTVTVDTGNAFSYRPAPVVATGQSARETPRVTSPDGGDHFTFARGTSGTGAYGTAILGASTGVVRFTATRAPAAGTTATESFKIVDTDAAGVKTRATATFTVDGGSAVSYATRSVAPGKSVTDTPTVTSPEGGDHFAFAAGTSGTGTYGTATVNATTGVVTYTATSAPAAGTTATESFKIVDTDAAGAKTSTIVSFTVGGGSAFTYAPAPAVAKGYSTSETPSVTSPAEGDHFAFAPGTPGTGTYGTATVNATTGVVTYTATSAPAAGTTATDSFTIVDTDADGVKTRATATFTVDGGSAVTYAPAQTVAKGHSTTETPTVTSPEGGDSFAFAPGTSGTGTYGTATIDASTGVVTYAATSAPAAGTTATDSFEIVDTDKDGAQTTAKATFTVDGGSAISYMPAPAVAKGHSTSETPTVTPTEGGDSFAFAPGTSGTGTYGTATIDASTGVVTYTATSAPAAGTTATDSFTIVDTDKDKAQTTATATFTVDGGSAVSYAPAPPVTKGYSATETPTVTSPEGGDTFTFASGASAAAGAYGTATINAATGVVTYTATSTPAPGTTATDSFTIVDTDKDGAQTTAAATFTVAGADKWIGSSGSWTDGANWSEGHAPDAELAFVPSGTAPEITNDGAAVVADDVAVSNAGTITIAPGATFVLEDGTTITGGMLAIGASGGVLDIEQGGGAPVQQGATPYGATLDGVAVGNDGTIDVGASATLTLDNGTTVTGGIVTFTASGGVLDVEVGSGTSGSSGATLDNVTIGLGGSGDSGVVEVGRSATLTLEDATTIGGATLTIASGGTVAIAAGEGTSNVTFDGVTVDNAGTIAVAAGQTFTLVDGTSISGGAISIGGSGATLDVESSGGDGGGAATGSDAVFDGVAVANGGTIEVSPDAVLTLEGGTTITGGQLTIASFGGGGELVANVQPRADFGESFGGILDIEGTTGATLSGVGVDNEATIQIAATSAATLTLEGDTTIAGGALTIGADGVLAIAAAARASGPSAVLDGVDVGNGGTITIAAAAALTLQGNDTIAGGTITNAGTILVAGTSTIEGGANGASASLAGGTISLATGATLSLLDTSVSAQTTVAFAPASLLALDLAQPFSGSISGFGHGDTLDLTSIAPSGETVSWTQGAGGSGTLTVSGASGDASFTLDGQYATSDFFLAPDSAGASAGTDVLYVDRWVGPASGASGPGAASGDWSTGTDWTHGEPTAADFVVIDLAGAYTVGITSADAASRLYLDDAQATVLDAAGGSLTLAESLSVEAGTFELAGGTLSSPTIAISSGATLDVEAASGATGPSGGTLDEIAVSNSGTIEIGATSSATLILENSTTITGGALEIVASEGTRGTLEIETGNTAALDGVAVGNGGIIALGSDATLDLNGTTIDGGTLTMGAGAAILIYESGATLDGVAVGVSGTSAAATENIYVEATLTLGGSVIDGATIDNFDTIDVTASSTLGGGTIVSGGSVAIAQSQTLTLDGADLDGVSVGNGGTLAIETSSMLGGGTQITGGTLAIGASGGVLDVEVGSQADGPGGATLDGVVVTNGCTIEVAETTAATLTLEGGTAITGGGLTIVANGGLVVAAGSSGSSASFDDLAVTNGGTITIAETATLTLESGTTISGGTITDNGTIFVAGTDIIEGGASLNGGTVSLATAGAVLSLFDTAVSAQTTIAFTQSGTLALDLAQQFSASISGFGAGTTLDLTRIAPSGETVTWTQGTNDSGTLTVSGSGSSSSFTLDGTYSTSDFFLAPDSADAAAGISGGGTDVLYVDRWTGPSGSSGGASGDWSTGSDWTHDAPTAADVAVIDLPGTYTVSITSADAASQLYVNDAGATVLDGAGGSLTLAGGLTIEAGTFELAGGTLSAPAITIESGGIVDAEAAGTSGTAPALAGIAVANQGTIEVGTTSVATLTLEGGTTITGGTLTLQNNGQGRAGTLDIEMGSSASGSASASLDGVTVSDDNVIDLGASAVLALDGGTTITSYGALTFTGSGGVLDIGAGSGPSGSSGATLEGITVGLFGSDATGTVAVGQSATLTLERFMTISDVTLTIAAGGTVAIAGAAGGEINSNVLLEGVTVENAGTIAVADGQTFTLIDGTSIDGGTISFGGSGATLDVESASATGGSDATLAGVAVTGGAILDVSGFLTLESGTTISGDSVSIGPSGGTLDVEQGSGGGATLDGVFVFNESGGTIIIDQNAAGATLTIENGTAISGGALTIAATTGVLAVAGSGATLEEVAVTNDGTITIAANATLTLEGATIAGGTITNGGMIQAAGTTVIEGGANESSASLSGGTVSMAVGATLSLLDTSVSAQTTVAFAQSGLLALDLAQPFKASISDFGTSDTLDLTTIAPNGETVSWTQGANGSGTLTVSGASSPVTFTLDGTYTTSDFFLAPDSADAAAGIAGGGTDVLYVDRWNTAQNGDWSTSADWTHGTPAAATTAVIDDAGTYTVSITSADTASALYLNAGGEDGGGATVLDETNGSLTLGGALTIEAGTFELAGGTLTTSTIAIGTGGTLDFEAIAGDGSTSVTYTLGGVTVTNGGTIDIAANTDNPAAVFLVLDEGTTITGGAIAIGQSGGTIDIEGPTGAALNDVALTGNGGQIEVGMTSTATLTLEGGTTVTGAFVTIEAPSSSSGGTLSIGGASGSYGAMLTGDVVTNGGTIAIASAATFDGDTVTNNGTITIGPTATLTLDDDTTIANGTLTVGAGNGLLDIEKGGGDGVSGAELDSVTVTNSGTIAIAAAATLTLNGTTLDSSGGSLDNAGTIQIQGSSTLTLATSASGTGTIMIGSGATLEVTEAENQTIIFAAAAGTLRIDQPADFTADVSAATGSTIASGDVFDLPSLNYANTTATTGPYDTTSKTTTLTVKEVIAGTATTYKITLLGNYANSTFSVTNDGNGGADIAYQPPQTATAVATPSSGPESSASDAVLLASGASAPATSRGSNAAHAIDLAHTASHGTDASPPHATSATDPASESSDTVSSATRTADHPLASAAAHAIDLADDDAPFAFSPHHRPFVTSGHGSADLTHGLGTTHQAGDETFAGDTFMFKPASDHHATGTVADGTSSTHDHIGLAAFHFAASQHVLNATAEGVPSDAPTTETGHFALDGMHKAAHHAELFALGHHAAS